VLPPAAPSVAPELADVPVSAATAPESAAPESAGVLASDPDPVVPESVPDPVVASRPASCACCRPAKPWPRVTIEADTPLMVSVVVSAS
jgi:hypothetical protein